MAINGNLECGTCPKSGSQEHPSSRIDYFKTFCNKDHFNLGSDGANWQWCTDIGSTDDTKKKGPDCSYMTMDFGGDSFNAKKDGSCTWDGHTDADPYE